MTESETLCIPRRKVMEIYEHIRDAEEVYQDPDAELNFFEADDWMIAAARMLAEIIEQDPGFSKEAEEVRNMCHDWYVSQKGEDDE